MKDLLAPFIESGSQGYDTSLQSMAWCRRTKDKNDNPYYMVVFSNKYIYHITPNDYYKDSVKKFYTMWDDNIVVTDEVKKYRKHYKNLHTIPRYLMWRIIDKRFTKVSWLSMHKDQNGKPYYFIPKTRVIPFKTDTRFILKKDYYIFHQDINKNGTLKNKARLWLPVKPWAFQP